MESHLLNSPNLAPPLNLTLPTARLPPLSNPPPSLVCAQLRQAAGNNSSSSSHPDPSLADSSVEIINGQFALGCNRFPVSGMNQWEAMEAAAGAPRLVGSNLPPGVPGPQLVRDLLDTVVQHGLTIVRAW